MPIHPATLEHQLRRCMRPDAHLFVRPDWRRFVRPGFEDDHPFALYERKYSPDQPRVPAGDPAGGQWTSGEGGGVATDELSAAGRKGGDGHHYVSRAEVNKRNVSDEAKVVFDKAKTGPLLDVRSNKWDQDHVAYNKAVGEALDDYLRKASVSPEKMTTDQAREFLRKIFESTDPRIKNYNL